MALMKSLQISKPGFTGVLVADAYWKIEQIGGNKTQITVEVGAYVDGTIAQQSTYQFAPDMAGGNFIAQAYEYLKRLPEFSGAEDC